MRKIKKLRKIILNDSEMSDLMGGNPFEECWCGYDSFGGNPSLTRPTGTSTPPTPTPPPPPSCSCGCAGCIWEDGGGGFSAGMAYNRSSAAPDPWM